MATKKRAYCRLAILAASGTILTASYTAHKYREIVHAPNNSAPQETPEIPTPYLEPLKS